MTRLLVAALALLPTLNLLAQDKDKLILRGKRPEIECVVNRATCDKIEYEIETGDRALNQDIKAEEVEDIIIGPFRKPKNFTDAEDQMKEGDYATAATLWLKCLNDDNQVFRQFAYMNLAECYLIQGQFAKAIDTLQALRKAVPDTFFLKNVYRQIYTAHKLNRDLKAAAQTISEFDNDATQRTKTDWKKLADMLRADLYELQGNHKQAINIYRKHNRNNDEIGEEAKIGEMRCLSATGELAAAKERGDNVLRSKDPSPRLLTAAYNAIGDYQMSQGDIKEALLCYLRGVVELNKGGARNREHETALAKSAIAMAKQAAALKDETKKEEYLRRAGDLMRELNQSYPRSEFAPNVKKEIDAAKASK